MIRVHKTNNYQHTEPPTPQTITTNSFPLNLSSKESAIWSPARSLEQESTSLADNITKFTNQIQQTSAKRLRKDTESSDPSKIFPVSFSVSLLNIIGWY